MMKPTLLWVALMTVAAPGSAEPTRIEVGVLAAGAKFIGDKTGGARVAIEDAGGYTLAEGTTEGSTGNTRQILQATKAHPETALGDNASVVFELDIDAPTRLTIEAVGPLDYPDQQRTGSLEILVFPGEDLVGPRAVTFSLSGIVLDPEAIDLSEAGGSAELSLMLLCGCPIEPDGLWNFADYRLEGEIELACESRQRAEFEPTGEGSRYRIEIPESDRPVTAVRALAISRVHPQLSGMLTLFESAGCD